MPLPQTGEVPELFASWVDAVVSGTQDVELLYATDDRGVTTLFGAGYEFERPCRLEVEGVVLEWTERVQVVKSLPLARRQAAQLEGRLRRAAEEIRGLTPPRGPGRRQYREQGALSEAVAEVLGRYGVTDYRSVSWEREERRQERYEGRGRGGAGRAWHWEVEIRYQVTAVERQEGAIAEAKYRQGWRVQVTTLPREGYNLQACVLLYNGGRSLERDFHILKDVPLGIRPLYVREQEQIIGLTRLLTIALRLLKAGEELAGLYEGQPKRKTARPTATRLLKAITRMQISVIRMIDGEDTRWYVPILPPLLIRILELAGLSPNTYTSLAENSG